MIPPSVSFSQTAITMHAVVSLLVLVLSTLPQVVVPEAPTETSFRAVVDVLGHSRIFSGESLRLKCSILDDHRSTWRYLWFRGSEQLEQFGEQFVLWRARVKDSGKFYCQGVRDTAVGDKHTLQSLPVEINVDGGWAILQVPPHPGLVGNTLGVTCRVRGNPPLSEVFLYKDGDKVMTNKNPNPHFYLNNVTLKDQGMYSCRASWDRERRTHSVISVNTPVNVLEVLSQPILEIVASPNSGDRMKLICHVQYNVPAPAPPINYYFYKNDRRLGTATSKNYDLVRQTPGHYSCKVKVPQLNLSRLSEPKSFGQVSGPQMIMPQAHHPRDLWPSTAPVSSPDLSYPAATAQHSNHQTTAASSFIQSTEVQPSDRVKPSQPSQRSPLSAAMSLNQTAIKFSQQSVDMSGDYADAEM